MPEQPVHTDTFWNQDARCKKEEPTSYVLVVDGLAEQAVGTAVMLQYVANYLALVTNSFVWLGGWADGKKWNWLDGQDQSGNVLMLAANILGGFENGTCLGADPKTLGIWAPRPCSDTTGAVVCEMAPRRVCGKTGGSLPISPISLSLDKLKELFPKMPSIPLLGQILGSDAGGLVGAAKNAGSSILGAASSAGSFLSGAAGSLLGASAAATE
jgi:hypothetical protein